MENHMKNDMSEEAKKELVSLAKAMNIAMLEGIGYAQNENLSEEERQERVQSARMRERKAEVELRAMEKIAKLLGYNVHVSLNPAPDGEPGIYIDGVRHWYKPFDEDGVTHDSDVPIVVDGTLEEYQKEMIEEYGVGTYREHFSNNFGNMSWCKPIFFSCGASGNLNEGRIESLRLPDGREFFLGHEDDLPDDVARLMNDDYDMYSGHDNMYIALDADYEEGDCRDCPWFDVCETMGDQIDQR